MSRTLRWLIIGGVGALLTGCVIAGLGYGIRASMTAPCARFQGTRMAVPGASATPEQTLEAFVEAINEGDQGAISEMLTPDQQYRLHDAGLFTPSYYGNICKIDNLKILFSETPSPGTPGLDKSLVVKYTIALKQPRDAHADRELYGGDTAGFVLSRKSESDPWRIAHQGPAGP